MRHILALSGGKDSSALAIYLKGKVSQMEYVFCDTGEELDETYEYLARLEDYLCQKVIRLKSEKDFKYYVDLYNGVLPDAQTRWCTRMLKLKPFEEYVGADPVVSYVGIRADEPHRKGYVSTKTNIRSVCPFVDDNIRFEDVSRILAESGLGAPAYYNWRSRSGCYFCFFQQKREWVGLHKFHPHLFEKAKAYEKIDALTGKRYTWNEGESLEEIILREKDIMLNYYARLEREKLAFKKHQKLADVWLSGSGEGDEPSCNICHL